MHKFIFSYLEEKFIWCVACAQQFKTIRFFFYSREILLTHTRTCMIPMRKRWNEIYNIKYALYIRIWYMPNSDQIHLQAYTETSESNLFNFVQKFRFPLWYAVCFLFLFEMVQNLFFCFVFTSICVRVCAFFHNSNGSSSGNNSSSACRHCCVIRTRAYPPCSFTCDSTMHSVVIAFSISNWNLSWHYLNSNLTKESNGKLNRSL